MPAIHEVATLTSAGDTTCVFRARNAMRETAHRVIHAQQ